MANENQDKLWLAGNEAFALGAYEAGIRVASGYPGTPSTEILENFVTYDGVYAEWAPNEKVGLEVAIGASFGGVRALATMKHVGVNVAADPLFTASYTGVRGGLVIIAADDPEMHSSQNEQDTRNYALAAKLPMLEPSDPAEAKEFVKIAARLSEEFDTPVFVRTSTRLSHVKGIVSRGAMEKSTVEPGIERNPGKLVMLPANARKRRLDIADRFRRLTAFAETFPENHIEWGERKIGVITAGVAYLYAKEALPEASFLKLGMCWPLPEKLIREFAAGVEELYVVEELDPFLETQVKAMGIACKGKEIIPAIGELNSFIVKKAFGRAGDRTIFPAPELPPRPPNMCPGCPHRGLFFNLARLKVFVSGDIGCYTLGFLPPLSAMDACVCMGASIGVAHGMTKALGEAGKGKIAAVIGDSTFCHSGITGLINMVYNKTYATVVILDNRTTAMTGHQENPTSGRTIADEPALALDLEALCRTIGVQHVVTVDPHDIEGTHGKLKAAVEHDGPSVVIARAPCALLPEEKKRKRTLYVTDITKCTGCGNCLRIGCPAIQWHPVTPEEAQRLGLAKADKQQKGYSKINSMCHGCGQCFHLCKFGAIGKEGESND